MKVYLVNADDIYFSQIKDYFREIISSYDNGNYRSAMVMLYSTIVCDLLLKLQELSDVYSDSKAASILEEINRQRRSSTDSSWEKNLIKKIKEQTELLSEETHKMIDHIYHYRNISAHPAMNEDYKLISPSAEITIAYIKEALNELFIKPAVFAQDIVDRMSDDIADKKFLYQNDYDAFFAYLQRVYLQRMTTNMMKKVFRAFWKFSFRDAENEKEKENREINRLVLQSIYDMDTSLIVEYVKNNDAFSRIGDNNCVDNLCIFLAFCPKLYSVLNDTVKYQIGKYDSAGMKITKWFISGDLNKHMDSLIENDFLYQKPLKILRSVCDNQGEGQLFNNFVITYYSKSPGYGQTRERYAAAIKPFLDRFSKENFEKLIEGISKNDQIYKYARQRQFNNEIMDYARNILPTDFPFAEYPQFQF